MPVWVTMALPLPLTTWVAVNTMFILSEMGASTSVVVTPLFTGVDSPVRTASLVFISMDSKILASAGT